jgi:hypothetical protein
MRLKFNVPLLLLVLLSALVVTARAQDQTSAGDEEVRGAFLTSRPTTSSKSSSSRKTQSNRKKPPQSTGKSATSKSGAKETSGNTPGLNGGDAKSLTNSSDTSKSSNASAAHAVPLGLGYTLYMRDANGDAVRVDPARAFHNGDRVRLSLEPNTDSYLYVFHTENNGEPEMIFPDARLNGGDNFIEAHVPTEIPSSQEEDERLRWFSFYGQPATERLYIVVTREPLPLVPTGDALIKYCAAKDARCPWRPGAGIWSEVQKGMSASVRVNKEQTYGQAQTAGEREATTRGFGLDQNAPAPSIIRMSATTSAPVLVTTLDLVHQ